MWMPSHDEFNLIWADTPAIGHYFAPPIHRDPRMYKYVWRVWTPEAPWEGNAFFTNAPTLSMYEFRQTERQMIEAGEHFFVYGVQRPRRGSALERSTPQWAHIVFAPAYDEDDDIAWQGHK
ncbi:hypothetical protein [Cupriavidus consociatus]|uniref:hypothetical protein n=1 Tax=Cupriavidus consociatus TaxID=2821357 RepID=UPI001AE27019|nr:MULTISPECIES: hypothetical protein [unclassified Cupriavidus]MBP0622901.1 hypothetical protein [Cupriavidus sp. LEh25]MDK2659589.1 hypothetical protein [Cupriavidus sp. LEh21]